MDCGRSPDHHLQKDDRARRAPPTQEGVMAIAGRAVQVIGANHGIGRALVEEAPSRGAKRVDAGTRQPLAHPDGRVMPLTLGVTNAAQIQAVVERQNAAFVAAEPAAA
jgi:NAD(P)-dependent dehydrogenase (short-subunit alcohol dehydrogenase family)